MAHLPVCLSVCDSEAHVPSAPPPLNPASLRAVVFLPRGKDVPGSRSTGGGVLSNWPCSRATGRGLPSRVPDYTAYSSCCHLEGQEWSKKKCLEAREPVHSSPVARLSPSGQVGLARNP